MIGLLRARKDEVFDQMHPEAYTYETLGGNNSRIALKELLEEHPEHHNDVQYTKRLVSVYSSNLSDEQAQLLAVKHNRQQSFVHTTTTQDKVSSRVYTLHLLTIIFYNKSHESIYNKLVCQDCNVFKQGKFHNRLFKRRLWTDRK